MTGRTSLSVRSIGQRQVRWGNSLCAAGSPLLRQLGAQVLLLAAALLCVVEAAAQPVNRDVLGLYDGAQEGSADQTRLHRLLEMPLNHLGYRLTLHDISKPLPSPEDVRRYHAVATWFSGTLPNALEYLDWARQAARTGPRFIVIDSVGALGEAAELPAINAFLAELGLNYAHYYVSDTAETKLETVTAAMFDFEQKLDPEKLPGHQVIVPVSNTIVRHLSLKDPAYRWVKAEESVQVSTGPKGGLIASGFSIDYDKSANRVRWIVNPFEFLASALGRGVWPVPDTTTVSGRRLYFSHIDGDGWLNTTSVAPYAQRNASASEVALDHFILPFPDLPVTVGLIAGDIFTSHGGKVDGGLMALRYFSQPQVEVASHTFTHPYQWSFFENYSREREIDRIKAYVTKHGKFVDPALSDLLAAHRNGSGGSPKDQAVDEAGEHNRSTLPRARPLLPFDLGIEVDEALAALTKVAPAGKPARLYLWSGDTRPFEAAVRAVTRRGVRNMNGGDTRLDSQYPSVAYVAPLSRKVGAERQIYAVNSNENTYTNGWSGPFDGFKLLAETLVNTERPRRLRGFNLYYHIFSASRPESLEAVVGHLESARSGRLAPITASHYAGIAEGFFSSRISQVAPERWQIADRGELDTVRFDNAVDLDVDYATSSGVVGHQRNDAALYVTLDPANRHPQVALQAGRLTANKASIRGPRLEESRWRISGVSLAPCELKATAQGFGAGDMTWFGLERGRYSITTSRGDKTLTSQTVSVAAQGRLELRLQDTAIEPLQLRIACATAKVARANQPARKLEKRTALGGASPKKK